MQLVAVFAECEGRNLTRVGGELPEVGILVEDDVAIRFYLCAVRDAVFLQVFIGIAEVPSADIDLVIGGVVQLDPVGGGGVGMGEDLVDDNRAWVGHNSGIVGSYRAALISARPPGEFSAPSLHRVGHSHELVLADGAIVYSHIVYYAEIVRWAGIIVADAGG